MEIDSDLQLTIDSTEEVLAATSHEFLVIVVLQDAVVPNVTYSFTMEYQLSEAWIAEDECREII